MDRIEEITNIIIYKQEIFRNVQSFLDKLVDRIQNKKEFGICLVKVEKDSHNFTIKIGDDALAVIREVDLMQKIYKEQKSLRDVTAEWLESTILNLIEGQVLCKESF